MNYSKQRELILKTVIENPIHPTADTVYTNLREKFPNISLGTVYRNLSLLADMGEIIKITTGDGADRFDGRITPHNHFICRKCHKVSDLEMESIDSILGIAQKNFLGKIDSHVTNFYGICGDCIKKP